VSYRWKDLTGYLMVNNLTNQKYSTSGIKVAQPFLVPAPRINLFAGLIYRY
jgi:outer membrane receptor protein involved in Fe transport